MKPRRWITAALALALFILNLLLVRKLLGIEYLDQMGSIEGAYIAIARWASQNWRDLSWFPLWYGGIPYQNTYPPLLHLIVAAVSGLFKLSPAHAHHAVTAVFFSLGPVTLFWLALRLGGSRLSAFAAGWFYSLVSTSNFLIPAVRHDAGGLWGPRRLQVLVSYGEGPHVATLALLPAAIALLSLAFEKKRPVWWVVAAMGMAAVALANWIGAVALLMAVIAWLLARSDGDWQGDWLKAAGVAVIAYLIASPWIPPSTIFSTAAHEKIVRPPLSAVSVRVAVAAFVVVALVIMLRWFRRSPTSVGLRFSILFLLPTACITLLAEWFGISMAPQPNRYHLEMELALALTAGFVFAGLLRRVGSRARTAIVCTALALSVYPAIKYFKSSSRLIRPIAIENTIEYREAQWFDREGGRFFAPGSISFFANAWTDAPQFAGGFDPGVVNPIWAHVQYQILSGDNAGAAEGEIAVLWLKAFGVDAVSTGGPGSREYFKPYRNPRKFEGLLTELWREGDDVIYRVPRRSDSLAHVLRPGELAARRPVNGLDVDPVRPYVAALEDPSLPLATMTWRNRHQAVISTNMQDDQVLSVQVSYHAGWKASVGGEPRMVHSDTLGQIVVEPECAGPCTVELTYDGGVEARLTRLASFSTLLGAALWIAVSAWRRRRSKS